MTPATRPLFLPITQDAIEQIQAANALSDAHDFSLCDLASLLTLQHITHTHPSQLEAERFLARTLQTLLEVEQEVGAEALIRKLAPKLEIESIRSGIALMPENYIQPLDSETIAARAFLNLDGEWDFDFSARYLARDQHSNELPPELSSLHFTDPQLRSYKIIKADTDDHLHIQGYAGVGKTYLVARILDLLQEMKITLSRILVLTHTRHQANSLKARLPTETHIATIAGLSMMVIPNIHNRTWLSHLKKGVTQRRNLGYRQYAGGMNLPSVGTLSAETVARALSDMVRNYCYSDDYAIDPHHAPRWVRDALNDKSAFPWEYENNPNIATMVQLAEAYWEFLIAKPIEKDLLPPLRFYHMVKFAALNKFSLNDNISHILVDESHDLPPPVLQILDNGKQTIFSLGDEYQKMRGILIQRPQTIRSKSINQSVRAGTNMDPLINPIIQRNDQCKTKDPFQGSHQIKTEIITYRKEVPPEYPSAILVNDLWGAFDWTIRLAQAGITFNLLINRKELNTFVYNCIDLFNGISTAEHPILFRYDSWHSLLSGNWHNPTVKRINAMLEQGLSGERWEKNKKFISKDNIADYTLATIQAGKNSQFTRVMLTKDAMHGAWKKEGEINPFKFAEFYVSLTRARYTLYIPEEFRHWMEDLGA